MSEPIKIYTSRFCLHSMSVVRFFKSKDVPVEYISIDGNQQARQEVMAMNRGYASVPTLLFPDGTQLTEPSFNEIRNKLGMESPSIGERIKGIIGK